MDDSAELGRRYPVRHCAMWVAIFGIAWTQSTGVALAEAAECSVLADAPVNGEVFLSGARIRIGAYVGLGADKLELDTSYVREAFRAVGPTALMRPAWRLDNAHVQTVACRNWEGATFPLDVQVTPVGPEPVPLVLLPSLDAFTREERSDSGSWVTYLFSPGPKTSWFAWTMAASEHGCVSPGVFKFTKPHLKVGKYVVPNPATWDRGKEFQNALGFDRWLGATLSGVIRAEAINCGAYRASLTRAKDYPDHKWLAFPIHDANGGRRTPAGYIDEQGRSAFSLPLTVVGDDPRIGGHSLDVLPVPGAPWPQERICVPESVAAMDPPVALLRRLPGSEPFREHLELSFGPDAMARDWDDAECVAVFANIEPSDLLDVVARLAKVQVDPDCRERVVDYLRSLPREASAPVPGVRGAIPAPDDPESP